MTPWPFNIRSFPLDPHCHLMPFLCSEHIFVVAAATLPSFAGPRAIAAGKASPAATGCNFQELGDAWCELHRTKCSFTMFHCLLDQTSKIHLPVVGTSDLKLELVGVHPIKSVKNWQFRSVWVIDGNVSHYTCKCLSGAHYLQSTSQLSMPLTHQIEQTFGRLDT